MRYLLIILVSLLTIPTPVGLSIAVTELTAEEARDMGLVLSFKDPNTYFLEENTIGVAPLFITLEPDPFSACEIASVLLTVRDSREYIVFAVNIEERLGRYDLHLLSDYVESSKLRVECGSGSTEKLRGFFEFKVGESINFPQ